MQICLIGVAAEGSWRFRWGRETDEAATSEGEVAALAYREPTPAVKARMTKTFAEEFARAAAARGVPVGEAELEDLQAAVDDQGRQYLEMVADGAATRFSWNGTDADADRLVREMARLTAEYY